MKKILLPIDGSETCFEAYKYARDIAKKFQSEVHILHVRHAFSYPYLGEDSQSEYNEFMDEYLHGEDDEELKEKLEYKGIKYTKEFMDNIATKILDNAVKFFKEEGVDIKPVFLEGRPAQTILDYSEEEDFDVIIMCTHGMSAVKRFTLGSVTNKVVHHAKIPVLVIR